jgi:Spy/CpxP family protein refolding chaperone
MTARQMWGAGLVALVMCGFVAAQDAGKSVSKKEAVSKKDAAEKVTGRLPNNYGRLGLSDAQRQNIYKIQAKYQEEIEALTKQLEALRQKRDSEIEAVLTAEQKTKLQELQAESAKKKASTKPKAEPEGTP